MKEKAYVKARVPRNHQTRLTKGGGADGGDGDGNCAGLLDGC
jgi:hypothetical protein